MCVCVRGSSKAEIRVPLKKVFVRFILVIFYDFFLIFSIFRIKKIMLRWTKVKITQDVIYIWVGELKG
jgi:hypothetical protein